MEYLSPSVIPSEAGIQWLQVLRDSRLRGSDEDWVFSDTLTRAGEGEFPGIGTSFFSKAMEQGFST